MELNIEGYFNQYMFPKRKEYYQNKPFGIGKVVKRWWRKQWKKDTRFRGPVGSNIGEKIQDHLPVFIQGIQALKNLQRGRTNQAAWGAYKTFQYATRRPFRNYNRGTYRRPRQYRSTYRSYKSRRYRTRYRFRRKSYRKRIPYWIWLRNKRSTYR